MDLRIFIYPYILFSLCFYLCSTRKGLHSFLAGEGPQEPEPDYRTDQCPDTVVYSMEELKNYKYKTVESTDDGDSDGDEGDKGDRGASNGEPATSSLPESSQVSSVSGSKEINISKLDIRVGIINNAWEHPDAEKLLCEDIDLGEQNGPRQVVSGLKAYYDLNDLIGRRVLVLANLKERKMVGFPSHGMVLCASSTDSNGNVKVQLIVPPDGAQVGERITVDGFNGEPATENQVMKKKMLDKIFPDLSTNDRGVATYKGIPLQTSAGVCRCDLTNAPIR